MSIFSFIFLLLAFISFSATLHAQPTFTKDIAPILYTQCITCHRPGQAAPFSLIQYEEVKKRSRQIAEVTASRYMPPWLPDPSVNHFVGERRLTDAQIALFAEWHRSGTPQGDPSALQPPPKFNDDWQLGAPDLIIRLPQEFILPAEGRDVYRNFVIPIPTLSNRYVRGFEFRPGNLAVSHHAFFRMDRTSNSRAIDAREPGLGFPGMDTPSTAESPQGHFLSWQPGKRSSFNPPGLSWTLHRGADLLIQMHLQPTGKPEPLQPEVALYFTDQPPTNQPFKLNLTSFRFSIPPGDTNYLVTDSYTIPVDLDLLRILPHAHYLGRRLESYAILPDGSKKDLLLIPEWDFNWQGDYEYAQPISLPKNSVLHMRFSYDNSTNNHRNPGNPPRQVSYGVQTTDEMAEIWLQVLPRNTNDLALLRADHEKRALRDILDYNQYRLTLNPRDPKAHLRLGQALLALGQHQDALLSIRKAAELDPAFDEPLYQLGVMSRMSGDLDNAKRFFKRVITLNPAYALAHGNLGLISLQEGDFRRAESYLKKAVELDPLDFISHDSLGLIYRELGQLDKAATHFKAAVEANPADPEAKAHLESLLQLRQGLK
ncbi:MAG: tetratricopeptide repeat protein [Verrucomicrobiota bacterium]|nr:tetratricopeptide repeat protein [Verrucomicrobiota bacterium]